MVPIAALEPATLEALRPIRPDDATGLRVDLDALERILARAVSDPPERALGRILRAAGTALSFEGGASSSYAGEPCTPSADPTRGGEARPGGRG